MTNSRYTNAQRLKALEVFDRTQSATKTVRELGYPGRWTLHRWIRQRFEPPSRVLRAPIAGHSVDVPTYAHLVTLRVMGQLHGVDIHDVRVIRRPRVWALDVGGHRLHLLPTQSW